MNVGNSVRIAINDWERREIESAMLHACNAVDGTAGKCFSQNTGNKKRFTDFLRDSYPILGPMGIPGIDLVETRFPVSISAPSACGGKPDLADVIYSIHRCCHGHGDELPDGFDLIEDAAGLPSITRIRIEKGKLYLSDRIIFGLLAAAVLSPVNIGQTVPDGYFLSFGESRLIINDWWGGAERFATLAASQRMPLVRLDFGDWMD